MPATLLGTVEASYRIDGDEETWLRGICEAARPALDRGHCYAAFMYAAVGDRIELTRALGIDPPTGDEVLRAMAAATPDMLNKALIYCGRPFITSSSVLGAYPRGPEMLELFRREFWGPVGAIDCVGVNAAEPDRTGVVITAPIAETLSRAELARQNRRWSPVVAHIAAAHRLRRALAAGDGASEAVLSPAGQCVHAEGDARATTARDALRRAALAIDRARGRLRRSDPDAAVRTWEALVSGRWSLVDRFDSDGRRFLLARRNEPRVADPRGLSPVERAVAAYAALGRTNKDIGYTLGLATSTVATHLGAAARKLGFRSRVELVRALHGLVRPPPPAGPP